MRIPSMLPLHHEQRTAANLVDRQRRMVDLADSEMGVDEDSRQGPQWGILTRSRRLG